MLQAVFRAFLEETEMESSDFLRQSLSDKEWLEILATQLDTADRIIVGKDKEEGWKVIQISDPLANELADRLFEIVKRIK